MKTTKPGSIFIISAASGTGKTTLVSRVIANHPEIRVSVSHTTRAPRGGEIPGQHYHFIDPTKFEQLISEGAFLEYAMVYGNYYGTLRRTIEEQLQAGRDLVLEIDWQGAQQVRKAFPQAIGIFILPPSLPTLKERLAGRGTDSTEVIARRFAAARDEMRHVDEFEYVIINDDLQQALANLRSVVAAARLRYPNQRQRHSALFASLL